MFALEKCLDRSVMSRDQFAHLGDGVFAYVRSLQADEIRRFFPDAPTLEPGVEIYALLSADGTPILFTDTKDAAIANAWQNDLEMVSLH